MNSVVVTSVSPVFNEKALMKGPPAFSFPTLESHMGHQEDKHLDENDQDFPIK